MEASHPRSNYDRASWQGLGPGGGQGRWEHRLTSNDRERDRTRHDRVALEQGDFSTWLLYEGIY